MSFRAFIVLVGMLCFCASIWFGVQTFTTDPANGVGCLVLAIAGALFIWISQLGKGSS